MSRNLKRFSPHQTKTLTPKRPCATSYSHASSQNSDSPSINASEYSDKENGDNSTHSFPLTPNACPKMTVGTDGTPLSSGECSRSESTEMQRLDELRRQRSTLRNDVTSKEQTLHNLNLVKVHRTKVEMLSEHSFLLSLK